MEAVRIIKEMRNATKQLRLSGANDDIRLSPRIAIWENVPGAFSSNNGEDFRCVLEELARIENPKVSIPKPKKWMPSGCIELPCGCITWRTHDAQYWGVPQRRKRISLIVDFRDKPEPEIQLISRGMSRDTAESNNEGKETSGTFGKGFDATVTSEEPIIKPMCIGNGQLHDALTPSEKCKTLNTMDDPMKVVCVGNGQLAQAELSEKVGALNCMHDQQAIICPTNEPILLESNQDHATVQTDGVSTTLPASMGMGGGYVPMVVDQGGGKSQANVSVDLSPTLTTTHGGEPAVCQEVFSNVHAALNADDGPKGIHSQMLNAPESNFVVTYGVLEGNGSRPSHKGDGFSENAVSYTLNAVEHHAVCVGVDAYNQTTTGDKSKSLNSAATDSDHVPCVCYGVTAKGNGDAFLHEEVHTSLSTGGGEPGQGYPCVCYGVDRTSFIQGADIYCNSLTGDVAATLTANSGSSATHSGPSVICYGLDRASFNQGKNAKYDISIQEDIAQPIVARGPGGVMQTR